MRNPNLIAVTPEIFKQVQVDRNGLYVTPDNGTWIIRNTKLLELIDGLTDPNDTITLTVTIKVSDIQNDKR